MKEKHNYAFVIRANKIYRKRGEISWLRGLVKFGEIERRENYRTRKEIFSLPY